MERRGGPRWLRPRSGGSRESGTRSEGRLTASGAAVAATLTINGHTTEATAGVSLFDHAERLGVRVRTSCQKQGKCRECMVEVVEGMECLSPPTSSEQHLSGNFRLSC